MCCSLQTEVPLDPGSGRIVCQKKATGMEGGAPE